MPLNKAPKPTAANSAQSSGQEVKYYFGDGADLALSLEPRIQFQDGAGLRDRTNEEISLGEVEMKKVLLYAKEAAAFESWRADEFQTEKTFFVLIKPINNGASYVGTLHRDSVGGPLIRRSIARTRPRVAELLGTQENNEPGPTSILEMPIVSGEVD